MRQGEPEKGYLGQGQRLEGCAYEPRDAQTGGCHQKLVLQAWGRFSPEPPGGPDPASPWVSDWPSASQGTLVVCYGSAGKLIQTPCQRNVFQSTQPNTSEGTGDRRQEISLSIPAPDPVGSLSSGTSPTAPESQEEGCVCVYVTRACAAYVCVTCGVGGVSVCVV